MGNKVVRELRKEKKQVLYSSFWAYTVSIFSMAHGLFLLLQIDFLTTPLQTYFFGINEDILGMVLIVAGLCKVAGILLSNNRLKQIGIVALSAVWGMLFYTSLFWSFGMGYPDDAFIDTAVMLVMSLRVSYKGV